MKNVATLRLNEAACTGCGICLVVCPHKVFSMAARRASIADMDACMECGACAKNCPADAIGVEAGVGCATGLINEWLRERGIMKTGGDCCG
jgi:NAD-dependent dihydropyrimidine dehydrogenase PreA subunit